MADDEFENNLTPVQERLAGEALIVDVDGFEGPLDMLLTMSRTQKVDLRKISVLQLAEQQRLPRLPLSRSRPGPRPPTPGEPGGRGPGSRGRSSRHGIQRPQLPRLAHDPPARALGPADPGAAQQPPGLVVQDGARTGRHL